MAHFPRFTLTKNRKRSNSIFCYKHIWFYLFSQILEQKTSFSFNWKMKLNLFRHVFCLSWPQNFLLLISFMHDDTRTRWTKVIMKNQRRVFQQMAVQNICKILYQYLLYSNRPFEKYCITFWYQNILSYFGFQRFVM